MSLRILHPGVESRIVDLGRSRTRSLGVPLGGAADRTSFLIGNALVGNGPECAALEFSLKGPSLQAEVELACVVVGAPFEVLGNSRKLPIGFTFTLHAQEALHIGGTPQGLRAYLCVQGGFQTPEILHSRSSLEPLHVGDNLSCTPSRIHPRWISRFEPSVADPCLLRVVAGLQSDWFQAAEFFEQTFTVRPESNRMGIRLVGQPLTLPERELISEPVAPGAIQVTRDGQCIILGVDGQTIGGYPKIGHVIRADLACLGQLRPGSRVRFASVTLPEAISIEREAEKILHEQLLRLRVSLDGFGVTRRLQ